MGSDMLGSSYVRFLAYGAKRWLGNAAFAICLALPAAAQEITIAALGDSLTQGFGLPSDDGLVPQLQSWLDAAGAEARLINAGVSGDTTAGGAARAAWTLSDDVDAMILALGANDFLRGIDPAVSRANLEAILQTAAEQSVPVMIVGFEASSNYGPDYKAEFDAIYPDLAAKFDAVLAPNFFEGLMDEVEADRSGAFQTFMQADMIHPNAAGVAEIVAALGPYTLRLIEAAR